MHRLAFYISLLYIALAAQSTWAELQNVEVESRLGRAIEHQPKWANNIEDLNIVSFLLPASSHSVLLRYELPTGKRGVIEKPLREGEAAEFVIPSTELKGVGVITTEIEFLDGQQNHLETYTHSIPIGYAEELDITGEAAEVLLYPLPDDNYIARYIPCCNIYGGMTYAARVPVNPTETDEGLPAHLVSPFIVLEPDGMSASTMGLYLDMKYDPESFPGKDGRVALYELNLENAWSEVLSYQLDVEKRVVTTHCPEGGTFVLVWVKE